MLPFCFGIHPFLNWDEPIANWDDPIASWCTCVVAVIQTITFGMCPGWHLMLFGMGPGWHCLLAIKTPVLSMLNLGLDCSKLMFTKQFRKANLRSAAQTSNESVFRNEGIFLH